MTNNDLKAAALVPRQGPAAAPPEGAPGLVLMAHQADGVPWLLDHPRALLAGHVGLGKTVTALAYVNALRERGDLAGDGCRVLILTENKALIRQYLREIGTWCPWATVATSLDKALVKTTWTPGPDGPDTLIATYGWAHRRVQALAALTPALVILDEVAALDGAGAQHQSVCRLTADAPRVLGMSATYYENNPMEFHAVLEAVGTADLWPRQEYGRRFVAWDESFDPPKAKGWLGGAPDPEVTDYLRRNVLERDAHAAGLTLPTRVGPMEPRYVPLHDAQLRAYRKADGNRFRTVQGLMTVALHHNGHSPLAYEAVGEILSSPAENFILYCERKDVLTIAEAYLTGTGVSWVRIDGDTAEAGRHDAVAAFWDPRGPRVILGTRVLERGLNLQCSRRLISIGTSWNPGRETQREGRVRRIGSPHATYEHLYLLPDVNLAKAQMGVQDRKRAQGDALTW